MFCFFITLRSYGLNKVREKTLFRLFCDSRVMSYKI